MISRTDQYKVVINHEEQYSIFPVGEILSREWKDVGKTGTSTECLKFIEEVWTDMTYRDKERILKSLGK